ncbi:MAG: hypothetical protein ACFFD4_11670 [Candidatus Odinarchaeota archaeon]
MIIREFLCLHESGTVIFHQKYQRSGDSKDIILRSGLISALYTFAKQVEHDAIDSIRMEKVTLLFKKGGEFLFVLFLESRVNPAWLRKDIASIQNRFFDCYPEIQWHKQVVNLSMFESFRKEADRILLPLNKKLDIILFLIEEGLITEEDYMERDLLSLGSMVGARIIERKYDQFTYAMESGKEEVLTQVDNVLALFDGEHVERNEEGYFFTCSSCLLCGTSKSDCFYEGLLESILSALNLSFHFRMGSSAEKQVFNEREVKKHVYF